MPGWTRQKYQMKKTCAQVLCYNLVCSGPGILGQQNEQGPDCILYSAEKKTIVDLV